MVLSSLSLRESSWSFILQGPVVQNVDNAIHRVNHYPADNAISFCNTCPLDSDLSGGLRYPTFQLPGPDLSVFVMFDSFSNLEYQWLILLSRLKSGLLASERSTVSVSF